uniref:Ig mu chain C region n=1 Tax=Ailuropoda melanoleuca TaxID=9646 RepID=G1LE35_AILME
GESNPSPPNLFPLITCESFQSDETLVAMGCLARDFLPSSITFSWNYQNTSEVGNRDIKNFPSVLREGKYVATSQVFLPSVDVLQGSDEYLTCKVKHSNGDKSVKVPILVPAELPPNVTVFIPPRDAFSGNGQRTSQLICQAKGFSPQQISVSWLRDGKRIESGIDTGRVEADDKVSGVVTYKVLSMLTITESAWLSQSVFTCQVEHNGVVSEKNVSSMCTPSDISIFTIPPSFASIFLTKSAKLSCLVTDLATYDSLTISWTRQNGEPLKTHTNISESHPNITFSAMGEATVCVEDWESGEQFTCMVTHTDLPSPLKKTISRPKGRDRLLHGFENLNTMASTFIVLFLLSVFYSTTVTLFKVAAGLLWEGEAHVAPGSGKGAHTICRLQVK